MLPAARACGVCGVMDIPYGIDWPWWHDGRCVHAKCHPLAPDQDCQIGDDGNRIRKSIIPPTGTPPETLAPGEYVSENGRSIAREFCADVERVNGENMLFLFRQYDCRINDFTDDWRELGSGIICWFADGSTCSLYQSQPGRIYVKDGDGSKIVKRVAP